MPLLTVLAALAGVALLTILALSFSPRFRAAQARRLSRSVGLALTDDVAPIVERALAIRQRATVAGALAGLALGGTTAAIGPFELVQQWVLIAGFFLGVGVGSAVGAVLARPRADAGARIARSREVALRDYVMPLELTGARVLIGVVALGATLVAALLVGNPRETTSLVSLVVVSALAVAALVVFELLGRAIVAQPSPARDVTRLAWEDALRAETLRSLVTAPLTVGCVAVMLTVVGVAGALPLGPAAIILGAVVPLVVLAAVVAIGIVALASTPQRHFLRALWPETAAAAARPLAPTESAR